MPEYNKLVRDQIPNIISKSGKKFETRILSDKEFLTELKKKMQEELYEYYSATNHFDAIEELADLLELIATAAKTHGSSLEDVEILRKKKANERGGFDDRIFLVSVED
ncbi:nucleoside triphosphate pyrophosphohydrolase [Jeotgalibacillus aurantiacus]|uniref:nucleoside triphosphate pyrophosphohydrolase n=1 Tax=Jeotgalibacillus aurantiacus TaxID=2763266 RepID=UPI001D0B57C8|nr:nucleoside triphosphate pyrophosphohydrolase [Jeotgalibacillus aurantiacus]